MSRKGNRWDNAVMECFFRSLKTERLNYQRFANHYEVVQNVERVIFTFITTKGFIQRLGI
jgi:putative transposase